MINTVEPLADKTLVDLPMARVKFNVNTEYQYISNFKVLQSMHQQFPSGRPGFGAMLTRNFEQTRSPDMESIGLYRWNP